MKFLLGHSKSIAIVLCLVLVLQLTACGTLLYPERRGQEGGKIDPVVAVMDGVGLLFFLIPGIIAFGVDIGTGAIYLPPGGRSELPPSEEDNGDEEPFRVVYVDPETIDIATIEATLLQETGIAVDLADSRLEVSRAESLRLLTQRIAATHPVASPVRQAAADRSNE